VSSGAQNISIGVVTVVGTRLPHLCPEETVLRVKTPLHALSSRIFLFNREVILIGETSLRQTETLYGGKERS
jgi:hypothetical protein